MILHPSERIKEFRINKGLSQEELSEISNISIRTIQRMESGKFTLKGDSLKKLAKALEVPIESILAVDKKEDLGSLSLIAISGVSYLIHPFLGILLPILLWSLNRNRIINADECGKRVVNFQLSWQLLFFSLFIILINNGSFFIPYNFGVTAWSNDIFGPLNSSWQKNVIIVVYFLNLLLTLLNMIRIRNNKLPIFLLSFRFF